MTEQHDALAAARERLSQLHAVRDGVDVLIRATEQEVRNLRAPSGLRAPAELEGKKSPPFRLDPTISSETKRRYIEAGARLMKRGFGARDVETRDEVETPLLEFLTPTLVWGEEGTAQSATTFYKLWPARDGGQQSYVLELLAYLFGNLDAIPAIWREGELEEAFLQALGENRGFAAAVHKVAALDAARFMTDPHWYLMLYLISFCRRHDDVGRVARACSDRAYQFNFDMYVPQYEEMLVQLGLRFRRGVSARDFARIAAAVAEGLAMQHVAADAQVSDERNLAGLAVVALVLGLTTRRDDPYGEATPEEAVDRLVGFSA
jgi:hypothetical protein